MTEVPRHDNLGHQRSRLRSKTLLSSRLHHHHLNAHLFKPFIKLSLRLLTSIWKRHSIGNGRYPSAWNGKNITLNPFQPSIPFASHSTILHRIYLGKSMPVNSEPIVFFSIEKRFGRKIVWRRSCYSPRPLYPYHPSQPRKLQA